MIINIRGTSGSGKSTLIRRVMERYDRCLSVRVPDRRQPIGYILQEEGRKSLAVVGHYETACGGCDTITSMDTIYDKVRRSHGMGMHVLYEGLLISADFNRAYALHQDQLPLLVIGLDTPLDLCLESVNMRRWAKNPDKPPVNPKNTESKFKGVRSTMKKLQDHGVAAEWHDREGAYQRICQALELPL